VEEEDDVEEAEVALDDSQPKSQRRYETRLTNGHGKKKITATASDLQYQICTSIVDRIFQLVQYACQVSEISEQ
jgi:hypothetical protein